VCRAYLRRNHSHRSRVFPLHRYFIPGTRTATFRAGDRSLCRIILRRFCCRYAGWRTATRRLPGERDTAPGTDRPCPV